MPISFHCPSCQTSRMASELLVGRKVRCPECDSLVEVPAPREAEPSLDLLLEEDEPSVVGETTRASAAKWKGTPQAVEVASETFEVSEADEVLVAENPYTATPPPPPPPADTASTIEEEAGPPPFKKKRKLEETEMDMTPMVDVTFLLLIFFMVTAAFTLQKSIQVPKPDPNDEASAEVQPDEENSDQVTVRVDEFNTYHVITIDWEEEAPSEQDLLRFLRQARDGDSTGKVPKTLMVEANGESLHEKVVAALDAGSETGFEEVLLATVDSD